MSIYTPSDKVVAAHNVPHLLLGPHGELELYSNRFNLLSRDYLLSLLTLPAIIGGVGIAVVITFVIAILLRLLLLTCKLFTRKCIPGAEKCKLCCVCCRKGCTHPESRCSKCCCCYRAVTEISRVQAETSVSTQLVWHNKRRTWLLELHSTILVLLLVASGMVFFGQQQISTALGHFVRQIFSGVVDASPVVPGAEMVASLCIMIPPSDASRSQSILLYEGGDALSPLMTSIIVQSMAPQSSRKKIVDKLLENNAFKERYRLAPLPAQPPVPPAFPPAAEPVE